MSCRALRSLVLCWTVHYVVSRRALRPVLDLASCLSVHCGLRPVCPCIAVPVLAVRALPCIVVPVLSGRALQSPSCLAVHCGPRPVWPCIEVTVQSGRALPYNAVPVLSGHALPCIAVIVLSGRALRPPSCLAVHCRALRAPSFGGPCVLSVTRFVAGPLGGVGLPPLVCDGIDDPAVCCCRDRVPVVSLLLSRSSSVYLVALVVG